MWVDGVRRWQFLLIYSTIGWAYKSQKHADVILEWSLRYLSEQEAGPKLKLNFCFRKVKDFWTDLVPTLILIRGPSKQKKLLFYKAEKVMNEKKVIMSNLSFFLSVYLNPNF